MNYKVKNIYGKTRGGKTAVSVPGSKSITARAFLIAASADGESTLHGVQFSDDCKTFLQCLTDLGIECEVFGNSVKIKGCGGKLKKDVAEIFVGSAGTAARFLPAFLAFQRGSYSLTCSEQMKNRPVSSLINTLKKLGAKFTFLREQNSYPFIIEGALSPENEVSVNIDESSQFLSALLISGICANAPLTIKTEGSHSLGYVDMTVEIMRSFGAEVEKTEDGYRVCGAYTARAYEIEPDVSAACYFYAANKILGTDITVNGLMPDSLQGDMNFIKLLKNFDGGKVDMSGFSDQALTLAAIAPYLKNPTEICNVAHIRRQECDRIGAIVKNLTAMGVRVEEFADGVKIYPSAPKPAKICTFGDHRVAMSFAVTGLRADGIEKENAEVCSKTFKDFFTVLDGVCTRLCKDCSN